MKREATYTLTLLCCHARKNNPIEVTSVAINTLMLVFPVVAKKNISKKTMPVETSVAANTLTSVMHVVKIKPVKKNGMVLLSHVSFVFTTSCLQNKRNLLALSSPSSLSLLKTRGERDG